ncbi:MAG: PBP1A family penicillin-binding protein [Candidatus Eisenbacteria bacterium]|uniref:peptidoglycan glycosyltransferase n=1 Tax=Eiseniibacteriota bacterium TaxID=2212470 RepID=A0A7Y2E721_UNCEI|nr:PBP1A family penicillin-binding protein [Candidatus Eisenbacteria bacterium]
MRVFLSSFLLFMILGGATLVGLFKTAGKDLPSPARLSVIRPPLKTTVFDKDNLILGEFFREDRSLVDLDEVPQDLIQAFIAVEDRRFWEHWGVDVIGVARAAGKNVTSGSIRGGGSTITQQLARNLFLNHQQNMSRKIKEALLSLRIEQTYSKEEILEMYVNQIYFGEGAYGVQAAAQNYLGKDVQDLTLGECALLAGLPRNPRDYTPRKHPERALRRRSVVLKSMLDFGVITAEQKAAAEAESLAVVPAPQRISNASYIMEMVRIELEERYGSEAVWEEGLTIYTTFDPDLQKKNEELLEKYLASLEKSTKAEHSRTNYLENIDEYKDKEPDYLQGAIMVVDPSTGEMRSVVGGRDFQESQFNRAVQAHRQPGSAFKPFVFLAGIEQGFYPSYMMMDSPVEFKDNGKLWKPRNYDRDYRGPVTLRYSLQKSLNVPTVKLMEEVTPQAVIRLAKAAGIQSRIPAYRSISLGTAEVTLQELAYAYAVFANGGVRVEPYFIRRIEDRQGNILLENSTTRSEVLDPVSVGLLNNMMTSVMDEGTGFAARRSGFTKPAAGKSGTTDEYGDAWFLGFTPNVVAGVWVGYDMLQPIGSGMSGSKAALPIWTEVMKAATQSHKSIDLEIPDGIIELLVCEDTGLPATEDCPLPKAEYFLEDKLPNDTCYLHGAFLDIPIRDRWGSVGNKDGWNKDSKKDEPPEDPRRRPRLNQDRDNRQRDN